MVYTKLESLKNLAERHDGYGNNIRHVMEARGRVYGIYDVVADIISTEQKYKTAVETALGGSIQSIITNSEATVKQLIEYLKKNKYDRTTFLPLTGINGNQHFPQPTILEEKGVLGLANTLAQAAKQHGGLAGYLLERMMVVDTIDNAIALARKYRYNLRIAALEGELFGAGGPMTGDISKDSNDLLRRRREVEELEEVCGKTLVQIEKIQGELTPRGNLAQEKKAGLGQLKAEIQSPAIKENTICMSISQLEDKKTEIADSFSGLIREHEQPEEQVKEINQSRTALEEDIRGPESKNTQTNQKIEEKAMFLENARKKREVAATAPSAVQMGTADLVQKQDFIKENTNRVAGEIWELGEGFKSLGAGTGNAQQVILGKQQEIERLKAPVTDGDTRMRELEIIIAERTVRRETMAKGQRAFFARWEELTGRLADPDRDVFRIQAQWEKLEEKLGHSISYMWTEYEMTYFAVLELEKEEYQPSSEVKKRIDELKSRIKGLGNVNMNAVEDHKEMSERYKLLKNQYSGLIRAQAELEKIIEGLDTGMKRQFEGKFSQIRMGSDKVFKRSFRGGQDTLELMKNGDILEVRVQIVAQPPGKKPQNMMRLSSGEKALTAISLLFAIQNLKPSPFCLLDEIEVALDDSNVDRSTGYLYKLIENTQFIVITHKRRTMVTVDRLYGITMQKKGVSTLAPASLIEDDLDK